MLTDVPPLARHAERLLALGPAASDDSRAMTIHAPVADTSDDRATRVATLLEAVDWAAMTRRLSRFAHLRTQKRSWALAEDLAQEAIVRLVDPSYLAWDPAREPDLYTHLTNVVRGLASNRRRTRGAQEIPLSPAMIAANTGEDAPDAGSAEHASNGDEDVRPPVRGAPRATERGPEEQAIRREMARARDEGVATRFAADPQVLRVYALAKEGVSSLAEQAEALGVTMGEAHNARKRLLRGLRAVELGETPKPPPRAIELGETPKPPPRAIELGETPKPPPRAIELGETPKPPPRAIELGETPKPPPRAIEQELAGAEQEDGHGNA